MAQAVGIDIGGTNLRLALVSDKGKILDSRRAVVSARRSEGDMVVNLASEIRNLLKDRRFQEKVVIGIGVPGIVSAHQGLIYSSPHYPQWNHFSLAPLLKKKLSLPVFIDNDANMIAVGEKWKGAAVNWSTFLMVTLGTGIGGGIVIDGKIFIGNEGFAGEVGHMVIQAEGYPCACGSHGCFETYASATGLYNLIGEKLKTVSPLERKNLRPLLKMPRAEMPATLYIMAKKGNKPAREIFDRMGYFLGIGLASIINVTGIQKIVLGGGLKGAQDLYLSQAKRELKKRTYRQTAKGVEIRLARLGDEAGIYGSAVTALEKASSRAL